MAEHDEHSSFSKTSQQLVTLVALAFVVPIFGMVLLVQMVVDRPHADASALIPEAVVFMANQAGGNLKEPAEPKK